MAAEMNEKIKRYIKHPDIMDGSRTSPEIPSSPVPQWLSFQSLFLALTEPACSHFTWWSRAGFETFCSVHRPTFNATKHGKIAKTAGRRQFPLDSAKETGKACLPRACTHNRHAGVFVQASPARKFEAQLSQSRGKKSRTNANDEPTF